MTSYTVKQGETILDVVVNSTGSPLNLQTILDANNIDTWTPQLTAGQVLVIPDNVEIQQNNLLELKRHPVCDAGFLPYDQFDALTKALEDQLFLVLLADEDGRIVTTEDGQFAISLKQ